MKKLLIFLLPVMLTAGLASCELADVDIDTNLTGQLNIVSDAAELKSTEDYGLIGSVTVDVINDDLEDYEDLIQDIRTQSVTLRVLSIDSSDVVIRANSEFRVSTPTNPGVNWSITTDWPVDVGSTVNLTAADYSELNNMLEGSEPVTLTADGTCNKGNVHITLTYDIEVVVTANPLE